MERAARAPRSGGAASVRAVSTPTPRHAAPPWRRPRAGEVLPADVVVDDGRGGCGPRHASRLGPTRGRRALSLLLTGALTFGIAGACATYLDLVSGLRITDVDQILGDLDRPEIPENPDDPFAEQALNILVIGTDYRGGINAAIAGEGTEFSSDTTMLVHVPGDRSRMEVISIPRDSLVEIPACPLPGGGQSAPRRSAQFNAAFAIGGGPRRDLATATACTVLTVEHNTGVRITDHVVVEMGGLVGVVDALGGVTVDLPEPVRGDEHINLDLPAGEQVLDGDQAINFLRARGGTGMGLELGSDLARIERQQVFVDAMLQEVLSQNVITDAPQLFRTVDAVLSSISTGRRLGNPMAAAGLAWSLRDVRPSHIVFTPLPVTAAPSDPNRVVWVEPQATRLWERIIAGEPPAEIVEYEAEYEAGQQADEPTGDAAAHDVTG